MAASKFSICHTSARPLGWQASAQQWIENADQPEDLEYILCADTRFGFPTDYSYRIRRIPPGRLANDINSGQYLSIREYTPHVVYNRSRQCSVDGWNTAVTASTGDIIILNADDFFPEPHWDTKIIDTLARSSATPTSVAAAVANGGPFNPATNWEFALHVTTGAPDKEWEDRLMTLGIFSRAVLNRWGTLLYPKYTSMYSDDDYTLHAYQDGIVIQARDIYIEHRHPAFGKAPMDSVYRHQNDPSAYILGAELLAQRKANRFTL